VELVACTLQRRGVLRHQVLRRGFLFAVVGDGGTGWLLAALTEFKPG
jgi:hypothetical protein